MDSVGAIVPAVNDTYIKHGMTGHPLWATWAAMKQRCSNPNNTHYSYYGGRGIKVCERWLNFALFVEDMGDKPTPQHTLDRINNNEGYSPDNCRWASKSEQIINTKVRSDNKSGIKGVCWSVTKQRWYVRVIRNNQLIANRYFRTIPECERFLSTIL